MAYAYHAIIGTEEIRIPESEVDRFRAAALAAARDAGTWVPIQLSPQRRIEVLVTPHTIVRIETTELGVQDDDAGADWP